MKAKFKVVVLKFNDSDEIEVVARGNKLPSLHKQATMLINNNLCATAWIEKN